MSTPLTNWAGNVRFQHRRFHAPESLVQLQNVVRQAQRVRCVGKGHSFNAVADTTQDLITLDKMPQELELRGDVVTCSAATTYVELAAFLERNGAALHNLSSTPHVSVMGAIATCTHGSGDGNGNLTSAVRSVVYVDAGGDVREARAGSDELQAIVLGALGVVYSVTLETQPSYRIRQDRYTGLPWASVDASFDALMSCASSVSLFTRWDASGVQQAWVKRREPVAPATRNFFLGSLASAPLHMVPGMDPASCTPQGEPGAWNERLPHFRAECPPSADGDELQSEYFVAREHASRAMRAMRSVATDLADVLLCGEVRSIAADDFWLSPAYGRAVIAFHFTWTSDEARVRSVLPRLEAALAPFDAVPHWGKLSLVDAARLCALYGDRLRRWAAVARRVDPAGKFRNEMLDRLVAAAADSKL